MMKLTNLTFLVTENCDYNCRYCWIKKSQKQITVKTINDSLDFFYPFLEPECFIIFYGGEPLLSFNLIKYAVNKVEKLNLNKMKKIQFNLTTNGSHLSSEILNYFNEKKFNIVLSFDGLAQNINRKKGTFDKTKKIIQQILIKYPSLKFTTNSVFTPDTVNLLSKSLQLIIELGVKNVRFTLSQDIDWSSESLEILKNQLSEFIIYLVGTYQNPDDIPIELYKTPLKSTLKKQIFFCTGGLDKITVDYDGILWGCFQAYELFRKFPKGDIADNYSFRSLNHFINKHKGLYSRILKNYSELSQNYFHTEDQEFCFLCKNIEDCRICPFYASRQTGMIGRLSNASCLIQSILNKSKNDLKKKFNLLEKII